VAGIEPASESAQLAESTYLASSVDFTGERPNQQSVSPASLYSLVAFPEALNHHHPAKCVPFNPAGRIEGTLAGLSG
jgi:hypothetical protein